MKIAGYCKDMAKKKTAKKNGRPSKYKPEYATDEFIALFIEHCKDKEELVSHCGLAVYLNVCEDTIYEWKKVHKEFSVSLKKIKQISKNMLINNGLSGKYNSKICGLILSANHGVIERKEQVVGITGELKEFIEYNINAQIEHELY